VCGVNAQPLCQHFLEEKSVVPHVQVIYINCSKYSSADFERFEHKDCSLLKKIVYNSADWQQQQNASLLYLT